MVFFSVPDLQRGVHSKAASSALPRPGAEAQTKTTQVQLSHRFLKLYLNQVPKMWSYREKSGIEVFLKEFEQAVD